MNNKLQGKPLDVAGNGERNHRMATMVVPFDVVEQNMSFVASGVGIAERMHSIRRIISKAFLTVAFKDAVREQGQLVAMLQGCVARLESIELIEIADRLDSLNETTERLISRAQAADFSWWSDPLRQMADNCEKLDSLAESFRMSASQDFSGYVGTLVASAKSTVATEESWRDFVATLED